mgnify:CR=1 FL=1
MESVKVKMMGNLGFVNDGTDTASRHVNFFGPGDVGPLCLSYSFGKYNINNGVVNSSVDGSVGGGVVLSSFGK